MREIHFTKGLNYKDFFITPVIRFTDTGCFKYITIDWLSWYLGIRWESRCN